jgi:hypothetical protein
MFHADLSGKAQLRIYSKEVCWVPYTAAAGGLFSALILV